jgi:hypothetical protein
MQQMPAPARGTALAPCRAAASWTKGEGEGQAHSAVDCQRVIALSAGALLAAGLH